MLVKHPKANLLNRFADNFGSFCKFFEIGEFYWKSAVTNLGTE